MLKLYAFATQFVYLLREGMKTFNTPKYRQFAKRLGRLIRHTVHFVSDHWENFKARNTGRMHRAMFNRLQLEYDCFFLRAAKCIFSSLKLGIWQYLADIPYGTISSDMLWRIFYVLHLDYQEESHSDFGSEITDWGEVLSSPDLQIQFQEKCAEAEETELYFLLSAFANMALSRGIKDEEFIKRVVMDLFYIGFVYDNTRETNCKNCRDLLSSVCTQHPFILSYIVQVLMLKVSDIGKLSFYLVQELPWKIWKPSDEDLSVLFMWLRSPITKVENITSRIILSHLNWEYGYLPVNHHISTAITVAEVFANLTAESVNQGILNSSVNTMSNFAMSTISTAGSQEQQFTKWSWELLSKLRLHMMDRSPREYDAILAGNPEIFKLLLDFDLSPVIEKVVAAAVGKQPMACYCILLLTQVGHALPEILERGLGLLKIILDSGRFDHAIELLMYIMPIFLSDTSAIEHSDLTYIMAKLVNADQTYLSLAKTMITGTFPGPVTKELGNMIQKMMSTFEHLCQFSAKDILELLVRILTKIHSWNTNSSVLYLLDIICSYAFGNKVCYWMVLMFFDDLHTENNKNATAGGLFSIFSSLGSHGHNLILSSGYSQFPWLSFFVLQAEDNYMKKTGLWRTLVTELSGDKQLEEALAAAGKSTEVHPPTSNQIIIYRWAQQAMDTPTTHPISFAFWQRFFSLYFSRPAELVEGQEGTCIGKKFFTGIINSMYFGKIKASLKASIDSLEKKLKSDEAGDFTEDMCKLFRTFHMWIEDGKLMEPSLYVPALSPAYDPAKLIKVLSGETPLWMEFYDKGKVLLALNESIQDWNNLHFRKTGPPSSSSSQFSLNDDNAEKRIIDRLHSYDSNLPAPPLRRLAKPIPSIPDFSSDEMLNHTLVGPLNSLNDFCENHCNNISAYGSLNCSYLEKVTKLWTDEEMSIYVSAACPGTTVDKEKVACSGPALVNLTYFDSKKQEGVAVMLENNRKEHTEVENQLLAPISAKYVVSAAVLNNIIQRILKSFEKDLGKGIKSIHLPLASQLFCKLAKATTENWLTVPPLRHFISECLENLATIVVSQGECQAGVVLDILKESPHLSSILTPHFFPTHKELLTIYAKISELPIGDGSLPFVLLSKLDLLEWLGSHPSGKDVTHLIGVLIRNLQITGNIPDSSRLMIHGLHRKHLNQILKFNFPQYYLEILKNILNLSGCNQVDPDIWYDLLNSIVAMKTAITSKTDNEEVQDKIKEFAEQGQFDYLTVLAVISEVASHFDKDRLKFGLYGLYPKYRSYMKPLSYFFSLLNMQMIHAEIIKHKGTLPPEVTDYLWRNLKTLFDPWVSPIDPSARPATANWIQQLSDEGHSLMPWIPGDSSLAKMVFDSMTQGIKIMIEYDGRNIVFSNLLSMYSSYYASAGIKDHIFGVVHPALSALNWAAFLPSLGDIDAMMKIISMFLPQCHAFLGTLFVQIDWQTFINNSDETALKRIVPAVLCLIIKLSSEPSVRQGGRLLSIATQAESWAWSCVEYPHYEALAQWYVMSVDCRCIVKHKERNPLDAAIIRLFLAAAEFNTDTQSSNTEKKQLMWVKCCAKLLSSVCSKQKNFLSINQPALHTTLRKLLEDMDKVCTVNSAGLMVKDFVSIFNTTSSSVLPGSALVVTESWMTHASTSSLLIPGFLNHSGLVVKDAKLSSSLLEITLENFFREEDSKPNWITVRQLIKWPSGGKIKELLEEAVTAGHCLVIYAYIDLKHCECINSQEERVLASTLLEYLRLLQSTAVPRLEPKLPLLYKKLLQLLHRQLEFTQESSWVVSSLGQFMEILISVAELSQGWGQNILGAIGLGELKNRKILI